MDETCQNVHRVDSCPRNEQEWKARAKSLNCVSTPVQDVYHCALNDNGRDFMELCAPVKTIVGNCISCLSIIYALRKCYIFTNEL